MKHVKGVQIRIDGFSPLNMDHDRHYALVKTLLNIFCRVNHLDTAFSGGFQLKKPGQSFQGYRVSMGIFGRGCHGDGIACYRIRQIRSGSNMHF